MKTKIKITAAAVITVLMLSTLLALGCAPEVELTKPDFKTYNESKSAEYTNSPAGPWYAPSFSASLKYGPATPSESDMEIGITFPDNADILKATNTEMTGKLKEFLSIFQYSNPTPTPIPYTPSTKGADVSYTFARRSGDVGIIIKLDAIPNIERIVCKVDASKYKVFGQTLDFNGDNIGGETYDDQYTPLWILGGAAITGGNGFRRPEITCTIAIGVTASGAGSFTTADSDQYIQIATVTVPAGVSHDQEIKILNDVISNGEFQKYNKVSKTWTKEGTIKLYDTSNPPAGGIPTYIKNCLYVDIKPDDLGIYRGKASGIAKMVSKDNIGDKPAKILILDSLGTPTALQGTAYSEPFAYFNSTIRALWTLSPVSGVETRFDADKRNVVLEVYFNSIQDPLASDADVYPNTLTTARFNESVKLVYRKNNTVLGAAADLSSNTLNDLVELKITDVKYVASKRYSVDNTNINCIIITLDPSYQIAGNRPISLLLSPGFTYTGEHILFGQVTNVGKTYYKGTFFWRSYGLLATGFTL
jgi:hypothetical protein